MGDGRLPTHLLIDATTAELTKKGIHYYIPHRGDPTTGLILVHLNNLSGENILLTQQRDLDGNLKWQKIHSEEVLDNIQVSEKIEKHLSFDDDLWVVEIEDRGMCNPFEV